METAHSVPPPSPATAPAAPYQHLARSTRMEDLWTVRILIHEGSLRRLFDGDRDDVVQVVRQLRLPGLDQEDKDSLQHAAARLRATLPLMERRSAEFVLRNPLRQNLQRVARSLGISATEQKVLALAILMRAYDGICTAADNGVTSINVVRQVARIIGVAESAANRALTPGSMLLRSGLIEAVSGSHLNNNLQLARASFRRVAVQRLPRAEDLFQGLIRPAEPAHLPLAEFRHVTPGPDVVVQLLEEAIQNRRRGVNVLLHGSPGTGKTEFARTIAAASGIPLYEVSPVDIDGDPIPPRKRLTGAAAGQLLLSRRKSILAFDEVDAIFNDGSDLFGKPSTAEAAKCWLNGLLEGNAVPAIWIANRIWNMDPAFLRRFDLVIRMDAPPMAQREQMLQRSCGNFLGSAEIRRLAHVEAATPGVIERAANVVARVRSSSGNEMRLMEDVLDGILVAQGHRPVTQACRQALAEDFDIGLCNADVDLQALCDGLKARPVGRLCLYGPPGTGKTAFGRWVANCVGRPLVMKRVSDLVSPYVGCTEQNLTRAFDQAYHDNAILQIDEVDSFLQDRSRAHHGWEISQVNEFLTQLEAFDGIFIATTNLMGDLDPAAMRRFDYKIRMGFLKPAQVEAAMAGLLAEFGLPVGDGSSFRNDMALLDRVAPGDFAMLKRQHRLSPYVSRQQVLDALAGEQALKASPSRRIGFV